MSRHRSRDFLADYSFTKRSQFVRYRTGVAPRGSGEDYHFRNESDYYHGIEQARDMDRNDALMGTLADRRVDNIVQEGFSLDPKTGDSALDLEIWERWQEWSSDPELCDVACEFTWHEIERFALRDSGVSGDIVIAGTEGGALQIIEGFAIQTATRLDNTFLGVTRDRVGMRTHYHVREELDNFGGLGESHPIPVRNEYGVRQVFHVYDPKRASGTRGVTLLHPVFPVAGMLEDINFAKMVQQQVVSCFAVFRKRSGGNGIPSAAPLGERDPHSRRSIEEILAEGIQPGMLYDGEDGEDLVGFSPNVPNAEYFQQVKLLLQILGVNFGLPLCLVLMDGSETNFSGWRGAVDEARKGFIADQRNLVRRLHTPVYQWWLHRLSLEDGSIRAASERSGVSLYRHAWHAPRWSYIEPVADAEGDAKQLQNALTSPRRLHAARGKDWEEISEEIIADNSYAIERALAKAKSLNEEFPGSNIDWRDLIPMTMPAGQTVAKQDPAMVAATRGTPNESGGGEADGDANA